MGIDQSAALRDAFEAAKKMIRANFVRCGNFTGGSDPNEPGAHLAYSDECPWCPKLAEGLVEEIMKATAWREKEAKKTSRLEGPHTDWMWMVKYGDEYVRLTGTPKYAGELEKKQSRATKFSSVQYALNAKRMNGGRLVRLIRRDPIVAFASAMAIDDDMAPFIDQFPPRVLRRLMRAFHRTGLHEAAEAIEQVLKRKEDPT